MLTLGQFGAAFAAIAVGAYVNGALGFGMGMFAAPMLALVDQRLVPVPMLLLGGLVSLFGVLRDRSHMDFVDAGWALLGRVPGTALGAVAVLALPARAMGVTVALAVAVGVGLSLTGRVPARTRGSLAVAGALSGALSTAAALGAPPMVLIWQTAKGPRRRAALTSFFLAGTAMSLLALIAVGAVTREQLTATCALAPAVVGGFGLAIIGPKVPDGEAIRLVAFALCLGGAAALLVKSLV